MEKELVIEGDSGCKLIIINQMTQVCYFNSSLNIKTEWYQANIKFFSSCEEWKNFLHEVELVIKNSKRSAVFISENCNVELEVSIDKITGHAKIKGILTNDFYDESELRYFIKSDCIRSRVWFKQ